MIPVILDTDIGGDIDDHWALVMLLGCPELDLRLVTTVNGDTTYRARVASGLLASAGRTDVAIGIGLPGPTLTREESVILVDYAARHPLEAYSGDVIEDGVGALIETVMSSAEPVAIIAIGGATNLAAALEREPRIAERARVVAMLGSVREGYLPGGPPNVEANVWVDTPAAQRVFAASWGITISPLDSCGSIVLDGERYARVFETDASLTAALFEGYLEWCRRAPDLMWTSDTEDEREERRRALLSDFTSRSTVLFDTVAVYLAYSTALATVERLPLAIDDAGMMVVRDGGREVDVATGWVMKDAFLDHLANRLAGRPGPAASSIDATAPQR